VEKATPAQRELARRLLAQEMDGQRSPATLAEGSDRVCLRLWRQIQPLIGPAGFQSVLARALGLARAEHPFLEGVEGAEPANGCLKGLAASVQGQSPAETEEGIVAVLGNFVWLLSTFIGEDLVLRLLRRAWPDVPLGEPGDGSEEAR
jgi:hypothetical protein